MANQPNCLIIDSDQRHSSALQALCSEQGWRVDIVDIDESEMPISLQRDGATWEARLRSSDWHAMFVSTAVSESFMHWICEQAGKETELLAMSDHDSSELAELCIRAGFNYYFAKPFSEENIAPLLEDVGGEVTHSSAQSANTNTTLNLDQFGFIRGSSRPMRKLFRLVRKVAPTDTTVLVVGESGTGKELVAETLHAVSSRSDKPFITLNCAAIAENLFESELFGHEKGSFSGAHRRQIGLLQKAHGGTLFLDEITEMLPDLQAKLLRTLESGEIRPLGARASVDIDVRVIAATNRDPAQAIKEGALRQDLYYRLAHITVRVPPLRRRGKDVVGLAEFFLMQLNETNDTTYSMTEAAKQRIAEHEWPGNVRQLRHTIERAYILSDGELDASSIKLDDVPESPGSDEGGLSLPVETPLSEVERQVILANLEHFDGNRKATAEALGVSVKTLYNKLKEYSAESD